MTESAHISKAPPRETTRERLLRVSITLFGERGLDGVSTRDIARAADTVISSITYHFGNKDGLYQAVAERVADEIFDRLEPAFGDRPRPEQLSPQEAVEEICHLVRGLHAVMLSPETREFSRFILHEQSQAGAGGFQVIYSKVMSKVAGRLTALMHQIGRGRWSEEEVRVRALALVGQILVFRAAEGVALAVTEWDGMTPERAGLIAKVVESHLRAILQAEVSS